jgi:hypothetical protein
MVLASVPEIDRRFGWLLSAVEAGRSRSCPRICRAALSVAGHVPYREMAWHTRFHYATSSLGIIDLLSVLPSGMALFSGSVRCWCCSACCRSSS